MGNYNKLIIKKWSLLSSTVPIMWPRESSIARLDCLTSDHIRKVSISSRERWLLRALKSISVLLATCCHWRLVWKELMRLCTSLTTIHQWSHARITPLLPHLNSPRNLEFRISSLSAQLSTIWPQARKLSPGLRRDKRLRKRLFLLTLE